MDGRVVQDVECRYGQGYPCGVGAGANDGDAFFCQVLDRLVIVSCGEIALQQMLEEVWTFVVCGTAVWIFKSLFGLCFNGLESTISRVAYEESNEQPRSFPRACPCRERSSLQTIKVLVRAVGQGSVLGNASPRGRILQLHVESRTKTG